MIPIAILFGVALGSILTLILRIEYRRIRRQDAVKRPAPNTNAVVYRQTLNKGVGMVKIVIVDEFSKNIQGY